MNPCNVLLVHVATKIESKQLLRIILRISDIDLIIIGSSLNNDSCRLHGMPAPTNSSCAGVDGMIGRLSE